MKILKKLAISLMGLAMLVGGGSLAMWGYSRYEHYQMVKQVKEAEKQGAFDGILDPKNEHFWTDTGKLAPHADLVKSYQIDYKSVHRGNPMISNPYVDVVINHNKKLILVGYIDKDSNGNYVYNGGPYGELENLVFKGKIDK